MADGDYERLEPKAAELKRLGRIIAEARYRKAASPERPGATEEEPTHEKAD